MNYFLQHFVSIFFVTEDLSEVLHGKIFHWKMLLALSQTGLVLQLASAGKIFHFLPSDTFLPPSHICRRCTHCRKCKAQCIAMMPITRKLHPNFSSFVIIDQIWSSIVTIISVKNNPPGFHGNGPRHSTVQGK